MHTIGKVFVWVSVALLIPAAIILSTMALDIRSKWQKEIADRQEKVETGQQSLAEARLAVRALEEELQKEIHQWGDVWQAPRSQMLPPDPEGRPRYEFGAGKANTGLGATKQTSPTVYAFHEPQPGESSRYIGEFELGNLLEQRSGGRILRLPFEGEVQTWPKQGKFHLRQQIPGGILATIAELESELIISRSKLDSMKINEEIVTRQIQRSDESLEQRFAELNGDGNAPEGASQQVLDGLVQTLRKYEAERNLTLEDVQKLRRKLVLDYLDLQKTLENNQNQVSAVSDEETASQVAVGN